MRRNILVILLLACIAVAGRGQLSYDRFFTQKTLRVDYFHTGTKGQEVFSLDEVIEEGE